jgi:EAL domain-containing protein (putative c-di-GMP-specific phosphodiesterase class I)
MSAIAYSGLPPQRLELEITESVLLGETEANMAILHQLRAIGARISMDDFGTGYSSLSYLRSFPFDKIKIDRSFVRDLAERPDCVAIIRAVAGLGASLGISTTAEGVERAARPPAGGGLHRGTRLSVQCAPPCCRDHGAHRGRLRRSQSRVNSVG